MINYFLTIRKNQLKEQFLLKYNDRLAYDKGRWCGAFSFFAKSHVHSTMSFEEIIKHAQGQSKQEQAHAAELCFQS